MKLRLTRIIDCLVGVLLIGVFLLNYNEFLNEILYIPVIVLGIIVLLFELSKCNVSKKIISISIYIFILALINIIFVKNINVSFLFKFFFEYLPVALWLLYKKNINNIYWFCIAMVIAVITALSWFSSYDNYRIMNELSRNYVSIFLLISVFIITIIYVKKGQDVPVLVPIAYLILSILSIGRMGILSALLYCLLYYIVRVKKNNNKSFKIFLLFIALMFLFVLFVIEYDVIINQFFSRFVDSTAVNSNIGRSQLYMLYLNKMFQNLGAFIFGVKITEITTVLSFIQGNLHSSIFQVHASLGLLGLLGLVYYLIKTFHYLFKEKNYYEIIFLIVFLFRISTDFALCGFITDTIMIYFVLLSNKSVSKCDL